MKLCLKNKLIISIFIIFISFFSLNKNYSKAFTTEEFISAVKNVYEMAHNGKFKYGHSTTLPPCEDSYISCDRLVARALWNLGFEDQPPCGMTIGTEDTYLTSHGFTNIIENNKYIQKGDKKLKEDNYIQPGDIILLDY